jgi:hypothetical protein
MIEMPPFGEAADPSPWQLPSTVLAGHLDQSRAWFATTPVAILVSDDIVISVKQGGCRPDARPIVAVSLS